MFAPFDNRAGHYLLLILAGALLCLPNLGAATLWDIDEGNNATCASEMLESGDFIVPTFNYALRDDKPVLLYWLQMTAYRFLGVNERAARLPSALALLLSLLAAYELGRQMFGPGVGLLAGLVLGSTLGACAAGHFANPDALLHFCTLMTMVAFYRGYNQPAPTSGRSCWWIGLWTGMGILAKGPVALVLPAAVWILFLWWEGQLRRFSNLRQLWGVLSCGIVVAPWYVWVSLETKGQWLRGFLLKHNVDRVLEKLENHGGQPWYYPAVLLVGFGLWACFFVPAGYNAARRWRNGDSNDRSAMRFLVCWIGVYLLAFSIARTKLPNYVLPIYPAGAVLIACFLENWRRGCAALPAWFLPGSLAALNFSGCLTVAGILLASGTLPGLPPDRALPGLAKLAWIGVVPLLGALLAARLLAAGRRTGFVTTVAGTSLLFTAGLAASIPPALDAYKAPRGLAESLPPGQLDREVRIGCFAYFQPSLNFYCRREVAPLTDSLDAYLLLQSPLESYLFLPADTWQELEPAAPSSAHVIGRRRDMYRNCDVVVVANR